MYAQIAMLISLKQNIKLIYWDSFENITHFIYYNHVPKLNCWLKFSTTHHFASHSNVHYLMPSEQNSECHRTNYTWDWTLMVSDVHHQELETTSQFTCQVIKYLYLESKKLNQLKKKIFCLTYTSSSYLDALVFSQF